MRFFITSAVFCVLAFPLLAQQTLSRKQLRIIDDALQTEVKKPQTVNPIPFAKLLDGLRKHLPKKSKFEIHVDDKAFGKTLKKTLATPINFVDFPEKLSLHTWVRIAVSKVDADAAVFLMPDRILITTKKQVKRIKHFEMVHDISDLVSKSKQLRDTVVESFSHFKDWSQHAGIWHPYERDTVGAIASKLDAEKLPKGAELVALLIVSMVDPQHWGLRTSNRGTLHIENGNRLVVRTTVARHREVAGLVHALHRLLDLKVLIETRLYEVDRKIYDKHVRPVLLKKNKKLTAVAVANNDILKQFEKRKPFHTSKNVFVLPGEKTPFASLKRVFSYVAGDKAGKPVARTATYGVSFYVNPKISADRRFLKLTVFQESINLVSIRKQPIPKSAVPKFFQIPELRKTMAKGTVVVGDGVPIVLRVNWQPKNPDKKYVAIACPVIWIQEEVDVIRKEGFQPARPDFSPNLTAEEQNTLKRPKSPLPKTDKIRQILQSIVKDITKPEWKHSREFYGTPGSNYIALASYANDGVPWPKWFRAKVPGYQFKHLFGDIEPPPFKKRNRLLGIHIGRFEEKKKGVQIHATLSNVGGFANGGVIGAMFITYRAQRAKGKWVVRCIEAFDP